MARAADTAATHGAQSKDSPGSFGNITDTIGWVGTHLIDLLLSNTRRLDRRPMDRRLEVELLRRSIAMLSPGARDAIGRRDALQLLAELADVQGHLDELKRRLRQLAEEG